MRCCRWPIGPASRPSRGSFSVWARRSTRPTGTREHLAADGIEVASVSELTNVPPLVGGQVKTFHPAVYAGILARRDVPSQLEELVEHGIGAIDLVVVNVKPFAPEVGRQLIGLDEAIELIDVGGAALLGAAARNAAGVTAIAASRRATRRSRRAADARPGLGRDAPSARRRGVRRRGRVFRGDRRLPQPGLGEHLPPAASARPREGRATLRYGENPHQTAAFYRETTHRRGSLADATQLAGSPPSFNNLLDLDTAYRIASDYTAPTVVIAKHTDPVGIASADELVEAYRKALETGSGRVVRRDRRRQSRARRTHRARDRRELVRGRRRARLQSGRAGPPPREPGLELLSIPPDPTEGMRDYGIANLDFKRVGGGLLVEGLDRVDLGHGPGQVGHQAASHAWASSPTCCSPGPRRAGQLSWKMVP